MKIILPIGATVRETVHLSGGRIAVNYVLKNGTPKTKIITPVLRGRQR